MSELLNQIDWDMMLQAIQETLFMAIVSLIASVVIGMIMGIILYITQDDGLYPNKIIHRFLDFIVNLFRAIPFIILIFILLEFTLAIVGTMLGSKSSHYLHLSYLVPHSMQVCV